MRAATVMMLLLEGVLQAWGGGRLRASLTASITEDAASAQAEAGAGGPVVCMLRAWAACAATEVHPVVLDE